MSQKITNAVSESVFAVTGTRLLKEISDFIYSLVEVQLKIILAWTIWKDMTYLDGSAPCTMARVFCWEKNTQNTAGVKLSSGSWQLETDIQKIHQAA